MESSTIVQLVTSYPLHNEPVIKNRLVPFIKVLHARGYKVQVISPDTSQFVVDGLEFEHVTSPDYKSKPRGFIKRMLYEVMQSYRLLKLAKTKKHDIMVITIPSMFLLFGTCLLPKNKFHIDLRDLTWEYLPDKGVVNKYGKFIFRCFAKLSLKRAKSINVTNDSELSYLRKSFGLKNSILKVPNGVSKAQFNKLSALLNNQNDKPVMAYIGNIGIAQELDILVRLAKRLPEMEIYIVGAGTDFDRVNSIAEQHGLENVHITGRLPWIQVLEIYEKVNILYAQLSSEFTSAVPSKLYEYLSTGKFIIYGGGHQAETTLSEFEHCMVIPSCDDDVLYKTVIGVIEHECYVSKSESNKKLIKSHFIRENAVENFVNLIEQE